MKYNEVQWLRLDTMIRNGFDSYLIDQAFFQASETLLLNLMLLSDKIYVVCVAQYLRGFKGDHVLGVVSYLYS